MKLLATENSGRRQQSGFNLLELLVVIAIIGVLASLLLPSLGQSKERTRQAVCIGNLRQIGLAHRLYQDDWQGKFATWLRRDWYPGINRFAGKAGLFTMGGQDATTSHVHYAWMSLYATNRPLNAYLQSPNSFRCPSDKGQFSMPLLLGCTHHAEPSNWETLGCSYHYNAGLLFAPIDTARAPTRFTLQPQADRIFGLAGKDESWVPDPARYILMHEPPARPYYKPPPLDVFYWQQWHQSQGTAWFGDPAMAPRRFISPVLFVDGHVAMHNFTDSLTTDPYFPYEPTKDWIWYKPRD